MAECLSTPQYILTVYSRGSFHDRHCLGGRQVQDPRATASGQLSTWLDRTTTSRESLCYFFPMDILADQSQTGFREISSCSIRRHLSHVHQRARRHPDNHGVSSEQHSRPVEARICFSDSHRIRRYWWYRRIHNIPYPRQAWIQTWCLCVHGLQHTHHCRSYQNDCLPPSEQARRCWAQGYRGRCKV